MKLNVPLVVAAIVLGSIVEAAPNVAIKTKLHQRDGDMNAPVLLLEARAPMKPFRFIKDLFGKQPSLESESRRPLLDEPSSRSVELSRLDPSSSNVQLGVHEANQPLRTSTATFYTHALDDAEQARKWQRFYANMDAANALKAQGADPEIVQLYHDHNLAFGTRLINSDPNFYVNRARGEALHLAEVRARNQNEASSSRT